MDSDVKASASASMSLSNEFDIRKFVENASSLPGIYRMLNSAGKVIYIGKAKNLKNRLKSYFNGTAFAKKKAMLAKVKLIEITVTHTETEALILECQLIKKFKPQYNILLRDDKSYPFIVLTDTHEFPRLAVHRDTKRHKGRYFGPYPNASAVRFSLRLLQTLFPIRQCEDSFFKNRSRPCLQYQIDRCSAPCVNAVTKAKYFEDVENIILFLEGKSRDVIANLIVKMEAAAALLDFETAAKYRDQIASLKKVQERQHVSGEKGDVDIIAGMIDGDMACVEIIYIRAGQQIGHESFFPKTPEHSDVETLLTAFLPQYYLDRKVPAQILINFELPEIDIIRAALEKHVGHRINISWCLRGERAHWMAIALANAKQTIKTHLSSKAGLNQRYYALQNLLQLPAPIRRMECFDVSHMMGEATVAACVVFGVDGPRKNEYRRYNIHGIQGGDDYAALQQALERRYAKIAKGDGVIPDVLFIDGGKGQFAIAKKVLDELQLNDITFVGIAKGVERKPGKERLFLSNQDQSVALCENDMALHLIQQIRDEAHRFAIAGHRHQRNKTRKTSPLESISGVGPQRRKRLLQEFGGLQELARAGVEDLAKVEGISKRLADKIYDVFHSGT